jgi:hypothetical protein
MGDFFEDFARRFGPDEGLWVGIVIFEVFHDGAFQVGDAFEDAAADFNPAPSAPVARYTERVESRFQNCTRHGYD